MALYGTSPAAFPYFAGLLGGAPIFAFFVLMMVLQLLFVRYLMPETKGVLPEELEEKLTGRSRPGGLQ